MAGMITMASKPKQPSGPPMTRGNKGSCLVALAVILQIVTACSDYERFRGRTPEQVQQACDPQRQTKEECSRTLDRSSKSERTELSAK